MIQWGNMNDKTMLIKWSNTFACGIKIIDDQHKALVDMINDMFDHIIGKKESDHDYLDKVVQEAVSYIKVHFATEEKILTATKFSGYSEHKKAHNEFIYKVSDYIKNFEHGKRLTLLPFTYFLKEWTLSHIAVMDKQYFEFFKKIATRKANGRLSISSEDVNRGIVS